MKIRGSYINHIDVEINPTDVLYQLRKFWMRSINISSEKYINMNGFWEEWIDTHGSGLTEVHRKATDEELETDKAFTIISKLIESIGKTK